MPISYQINKQNRTVFSYASTVITEDDFIAHFQQLQADPDFNSDYNHLFDCSRVEKFNINPDSIGRIAQLKLFSPQSKRAVLAGRDLSFGLARMYELYRNIQSDQIQVFRDRASAYEWLGLSPTKPAS